MNVSFDTSPEELTELVLRSRSSGYWWFHWVVVGVAAGLLPVLVVLPRLGRSPAGYLATLAVSASAMVVLHFGTGAINRWHVGKGVRRWAGRYERLQVDVALEADGITFDQPGMAVLIRWSEIARTTIAPEGVELWSPEGRLVGLVRRRGFDSEQAMAAFVEKMTRRASGDCA